MVKTMHIEEKDFPVVGIGCSAGGMAALTEFFSYITPKGAAYIVIPHLLPSHRSNLDYFLGKITSLPVIKVEKDTLILPDHIYVLKENTILTMRDNVLKIRTRHAFERINKAIDIFFQSMAHDKGSRSVGIVLSGMGTDGSVGAKAIHAAGGKLLVQDPETTPFKGMPESAIEADSPVAVKSPEDLAKLLKAMLTYRFIQ